MEFDKYVINGDKMATNLTKKAEPKDQFISIIQFYMATCPDCQGFSPYFKRFVSDVGRHWRHLVRFFVVNCNDDMNLQLCWNQNPTLIVPLVRWYAFPILIGQEFSQNPDSNFPQEFLNVSHRQYVEGERRDHISLRRATLRYLNTVMFYLNRQTPETNKSNKSDLELFHNLPIRWHLQQSLDLGSTNEEASLFHDTLRLRTRKCIGEAYLSSFNQVEQFIITSDYKTSPISKTVIADWSNYTCLPGVKPAILIHYINHPAQIDAVESVTGDKLDFNLGRFKEEGPSLFTFKMTNETSPKLKYTFLISKKLIIKDEKSRANLVSKRLKRSGSASGEQPDSYDSSKLLGRLPQRMSLEQYYARKKSLGSSQRHPFRYANPMATIPLSDSNQQRARVRRNANSTLKIQQDSPESVNYAPPDLYPDEELIRYHFNEAIYRMLHDKYNLTIDHAGFKDNNLSRIDNGLVVNSSAVFNATEEDLKRLTLTDYYKVLGDIVHKNLLSKSEVDGYQMMTNICMLDLLVEHFPYQGLNIKKSRSRFFLELIRDAYIKELNKHLNGKFNGCKESSINYDEKLRDNLAKLRIKSKDLSTIQRDESQKFNVGLPPESDLRWSYCAGSKPYLRGHTCSLWVLFHTLTVREYQKVTNLIDNNLEQQSSSNKTDNELLQKPIEYEFKVKYSPENTYCDPRKPEEALENSSSEQLYVRAHRFALVNIINFVRFHLSCTNCAAHFSCMVHNSELNFEDPKPGDHLLWLWEAHNRVNVRTRKTHSEDPIHPKHVFPDYKACPQCYIEKPTNETEFTSMRFNRYKLIEFVVARYQKSAILNNKIRIEDLFHKKEPSSNEKSRT